MDYNVRYILGEIQSNVNDGQDLWFKRKIEVTELDAKKLGFWTDLYQTLLTMDKVKFFL